MKRLRVFLQNLLNKFKAYLAQFRKWFLKESALTPGHWRWAAYGVLLIMALIMLGMAIDFVGEMHPGIYFGAFLGAGIFNLMGGRWDQLSMPRRYYTLGFLLTGAVLFSLGGVYLLYSGKASEKVKVWSLESKNLPSQGLVPERGRSLPTDPYVA